MVSSRRCLLLFSFILDLVGECSAEICPVVARLNEVVSYMLIYTLDVTATGPATTDWTICFSM
jgi:hypothetical protein